jgi:enoyl-CoA hydratase/carnithine racemase
MEVRMGFDGVALETDGPIARIRLARPEKRNALSLDMLETLQKTLETVPPSAGAVILEAEGPVFSAGHDLGEMIDRPNDFYAALFGACTDMMESLHRIPQPVIAKVQEPATAAGCQLVASCDLANAATDDAQGGMAAFLEKRSPQWSAHT